MGAITCVIIAIISLETIFHQQRMEYSTALPALLVCSHQIASEPHNHGDQNPGIIDALETILASRGVAVGARTLVRVIYIAFFTPFPFLFFPRIKEYLIQSRDLLAPLQHHLLFTVRETAGKEPLPDS